MRETMRRGTPARLLSWLLALALTLSLLPAGAWAAGEQTGTVTFSVETRTIDGRDLVEPVEEELYAGDTVYTILSRVAQERGLAVEGAENGYVTKIGPFGSYPDSEYGDESGWMVAMNDDHDTLPQPAVKDGDSVRFCYTYKTYGRDIDLIDLIGRLEKRVEEAAYYEGENEDAVYAAMEEAGEKLAEIGAHGDNRAYLDAVNIWGPGSETEEVSALIRRLDAALAGEEYVAAVSVEVGGAPSTVRLGQTYQLTAEITPDDATVAQGSWAVVDSTGSAVVTEDGLLTPTGEGLVIVQYWHPDAPSGVLGTKLLTVEQPAVPPEIGALLEGIAAGYTDTGDDSKVIIDMAAYQDHNAQTQHATTDAARQRYVDFVLDTLEGDGADAVACALAVIGLQALGIAPQELYPADGGGAVSAVERLNAAEQSPGAWTAPYILAAYAQGGYDTDGRAEKLIGEILAAQQEDGSWTEYGESVQATANMAVGLALFRETDGVEEALERAASFLSGAQLSDGRYDAYGSGADADTCAMVVTALAALGIDPDGDERFVKNGSSALDGLLTFALEDNSGFGYQDNAAWNAYATEDGFRALIAASRVMETGEAYNIYDFSANAGSLVPGYASSEEQPDPEPDPPAEGEETVEVTFTLRAVGEDWLSGKTVEVDEGASAFDVFTAAIAGTGITYEGGGGYISSVTCRGTTLSEFDGGANAGWMYRVNGVSPDVGMGSYTVSDGDAVLLYYTADWTAEPDAGGMEEEPETPAEPVVEENSDGSFTVTLPENADGPVRVAIPGVEDGLGPVLVRPDGSREVVKKSLTEGGAAHMLLDGSCTVTFTDGSRDFDDVAADAWYAGAVDFAVGRRLFAGATDTAFEPEAPLSRAMAAAVLWQLEDAPAAGESDFPDVAADAWYAGAAAWVQRSGLMAGTEAGLEPDRPVTREELAAILYRYAGLCGLDMESRGELDAFADGGTVSPWAREAVAWAVDAGLLAGNGDGTLSPGGQTTRAEGAAMLRQMVALLVRG